MASEKSVVDTTSPAVKYEAMMAELGGLGSGPTQDKTLLLFQVLDDIIPHLGVFVEVMRMCRDEIFDCVFSDQYTGSSASDKPRYIEKLPYFTLVKRVYDERDERNEELNEKLEHVQKRLFDKHKQYEETDEALKALEEERSKLEDNILVLEGEILDRKEEITGLEQALKRAQTAAERMEYQLNGDIHDLEMDLEDAKNEIDDLRQYKTVYDDLQSAFQDQRFEEQTPKKKKRSSIATKRAHLMSNIENALKLEEQLYVVQNGTLEEFDKFLEEHKLSLSERELEGKKDEYGVDIEQADEQLMLMQERFHKSVTEINTELELLRQHRTMLQEQVQILEENKPSQRKKRRSRQESRPQTRESTRSDGEMVEEDEIGLHDPFIIHERVFSKYAVMLYTSDNNAKTFHEFKDAKFCPSCGEKTVVCPHKILKQEHIFPLSPASTHLKVSRPKVRLNQEMMQAMFRAPTTCDTLEGLSSAGAARRHLSHTAMTATFSPCPASKSSGESVTSSETQPPLADAINFPHSVYRLWQDYKARTDIERAVPRPLSEARALSLMEQFAAYIIHQDEFSDQVQSLPDGLYSFLFERYQKPDIAYLAANDLITTLADNCATNKWIWVFTHVLVGNLDGCALRYLLLLSDVINQIDWHHVDDYRLWASLVYPFLNSDDLETLQMGYTAFSENKISKQLVADYTIYTVMKCREPRLLEMEYRLLDNPGKEQNLMTESEFIESSDSVLAVVNEKLRRRLFGESLAMLQSRDSSEDSLPVIRLAQITSYLSLLQIESVVREMVDELDQSRANLARETTTPGRAEQPTHSADKLLTLSDIKTLAHNIARRNMHRKLKTRSGVTGY